MLRLDDLSVPGVRVSMMSEIEMDEKSATGLYMSRRFNPRGVQEYPGILKLAVSKEDDEWLANVLNQQNLFNQMEERKTKHGVTLVKVPYTAAETFAEGEMNRFYIRGLCLVALAADPSAELEIYRAKSVSQPRPESELMIGMTVNAAKLLADLRQNPGVDTALGLPPGPNSGLSVRLIRS